MKPLVNFFVNQGLVFRLFPALRHKTFTNDGGRRRRTPTRDDRRRTGKHGASRANQSRISRQNFCMKNLRTLFQLCF